MYEIIFFTYVVHATDLKFVYTVCSGGSGRRVPTPNRDGDEWGIALVVLCGRSSTLLLRNMFGEGGAFKFSLESTFDCPVVAVEAVGTAVVMFAKQLPCLLVLP